MALAFLCKKQPTIIRCTGGNTNAFCNTYLVAWLRRNLLLPDCFVGTCNFWWYFLCLAWLILASLVLLGCSPGLALFACFAALASSCFFGKSWAVTVQWKSCFASCFKIPSRKVDSPARPLPSQLFHVEATGKQEDTVERKTTGNTKGSKSKHPKNPQLLYTILEFNGFRAILRVAQIIHECTQQRASSVFKQGHFPLG